MCHRKYNEIQYGILPNKRIQLFCNNFDVLYFLVPLQMGVVIVLQEAALPI